MNEKRVRCWHFLQEDRRLRWGSKEVVEVGKTYTAEGPLKMCENGMHGSRKLRDALYYAPGAILCEVEIWGEVEEQDDKLVGRHRKVLSMFDATEVLRAFARKCALDVIHLWDTPEVVIKYLKTGDEGLRNAAWNAARDATRAAASDVASAAASAAASDAAWNAARAAASAKQKRRLVRMARKAMESTALRPTEEER